MLSLAAITVAGSCLADAATNVAFRLADAVIIRANVEKADGLFSTQKAADDLAQVISNMTGRAPAIYPLGKEPQDSAAPLIYLGDAPAARDAGLSPDGLRLGDWRVKTIPGAAFIYGRSGYAVCSAVFDFAEKAFDYHVLFPDDGPDVFESNPDAVVPVLDRTVKPAIYRREMYSARFNGPKFPYTKSFWERYGRARSCEPGFGGIEAKYRVSGQTKGCHSSFDYCPPEKYGAEHPEYYSMGPDGKRRSVRNSKCQLCYTNPDTYRIVLESLLGFIAADREKNPDNPPLVYDFTQMDNSDFICLCPECKKVIAKYNRVEGGHKEGGDAGLVLEFVNRLARDVREKYPDVQVRMFAYVSTERAPEKDKITIEPNVRIWWCNVYSRCDAQIPLLTEGHFNENNARELREWTDLTKNVEIWDYLYYGNTPAPVTDAIASNIRFFVSRGVDSIFMENEYWSGAGSWDELNRYVISKLYVEPDLDVDGLVRNFCRAYGKAAEKMYEAYRYVREQVLTRYSKDHFEQRTGINTWRMDPAVLERFASIVAEAYDIETRDPYRARMVPILKRLYQNLISIYKKNPNAKAALEEAKNAYRKWGLEEARVAFMEPKQRAGAAKDVENALDLLSLKFDDLPDELKDVPDTEMVLVCVANSGGDGRRSKDPLSPRGVAKTKKTGGNIVWGCYDRPSKKSYAQRVVKADEELAADKYTWVKLNQVHVGLETIFWFDGSWECDFNLKDFHILDDGMEVDPNWYDLWVSARYGEDTLYIDRLALRRIAPPTK
jgi:hypothetical protein